MGKGQVSLEFMLIMGFVFALLVPLMILYNNTQRDTTDTLTEGQIIKASNTLRDAAERVYFAGEPAQERVTVYFPDGIRGVGVQNTSFIFNVSGGAGMYQVVAGGLAPLQGTIMNSRGIHVITLRAVAGYVEVSE